MAQTSRAKEKPPRLDAAAWIAAAFDALAEGGIGAVRVEPLAKALDITKGSFYWHFADRRALLDAMFAAWSEGRISAIREQAAARGAPDAVLGDLADLYTRHANVRGLAIELAIRSLARADEAAAKAVRSVDRERLRHVGDLFAALGWPGSQAQAQAILFYSYLFGQSLLDAQVVPAAARDKAVRALIAQPTNRISSHPR
jgi:AcrR family transcriptional regulator